MRCLIVEDDRSLAELVRLEIADHHVEGVCTHSIAAALRLMRAQPPDALVIDLGLPDGDGLELAAAARELCPRAPALVFTGADDTDALAIFRRHANVRAVVAKRLEDGDDVGALARSVATMMREGRDRTARTGADGRCYASPLDPARGLSEEAAANRSPADKRAMIAALRRAAERFEQGRGEIRSLRPEASGEDRPTRPPLRA